MLRAGQVVVLCALALLTLGVVMSSSAAMRVQPLDPALDPTQAAAQAPEGTTPRSLLLSRPIQHMALAMGVLLLASMLPVRRVCERIQARPRRVPAGDAIMLALGTLALLGVLSLVYVPGLQRVMYGSARWITLPIPGFDSVQPSELAKWGLIPVLAVYAARRMHASPRGMGSFWGSLAPALVALGAVSGAVVLEDLGTGVLIAAAGGILLVGAGARLWQLGLMVPPALGAVAIAIWQSPYRMQRVISFIDPSADPQGSGYQLLESLRAVAGGGIAGRGLGHGVRKFGYLPEDTTDFLFAIVSEELGAAGAALVLGLHLLLLWTLIAIVRRVTEPPMKLIALGVAATISLQALMNVVVVTGLGPTKGIALPLLSSGGTGWILTAAMLGVIVAVDRQSQPAPLEADEASDAGSSDEPAEVRIPARREEREPAPAAWA